MELSTVIMLMVLTAALACAFVYNLIMKNKLKEVQTEQKDKTVNANIVLNMPKEKKFPLGHFALYTKGWYERSEDLWKDLGIIIGADGYNENLNKNDVYHIIVNRFSEMKIRESELLQVLDGINPESGWEYGYPTKGNFYYCSEADKSELPEWDFQEAVVRYCMSRVSFLNMDKVKKVMPDFKKVLPIRLHDNETMRQGVDRVAKAFEDLLNK